MKKITLEAFKDNFDEYVEMASKEIIDIFNNGNLIFSLVPRKEKLKTEWGNIFGSLPKEAYDEEVERE